MKSMVTNSLLRNPSLSTVALEVNTGPTLLHDACRTPTFVYTKMKRNKEIPRSRNRYVESMRLIMMDACEKTHTHKTIRKHLRAAERRRGPEHQLPPGVAWELPRGAVATVHGEQLVPEPARDLFMGST